MKKFFISHWPANKQDFKDYFKVALPILIAGFLISANNFVDNFMVASIPSGVAALSVASTWTGIITSVFYGISYSAAGAFAQFYGKGDFKHARNIIKARLLIALFIAASLAISAWIWSQEMILLFLPSADELVIAAGSEYLLLIAIAWILLVFQNLAVVVLRETKLGRFQMMIAILQIAINIVLNAILIYVFNFGVKGAAIGTITSVSVASIIMLTIHYVKNKNLRIKIHRIFLVDNAIWKVLSKRFFGGLFAFVALMTIYLRNPIWNLGYGTGSIGDPAFNLSAASIFGISWAVNGIFTSSLDSVSATVGIFVGWNLGNNEVEKAKRHADALKTFNTLIGFALIPILIIVIICMPYFYFLASGEYNEQLSKGGADALANAIAVRETILKNVQFVLIPIVFVLPIWLWIFTSINAVGQGNKNSLMGFIDGLINFALFGVIALIYLIFPGLEIYWAYTIFTISETVLLMIYEVFYYWSNWHNNITKNVMEENKIDIDKSIKLNNQI